MITQYFEPEQVIPAAAQGTLALELREDDKELSGQVNALADIVTEEITCAERLFLKGTGGTAICRSEHMPANCPMEGYNCLEWSEMRTEAV